MFGLFVSQIRSAPFLVFDKKFASTSGKVGEPMNCYYQILNLGDSSVTDLTVADNGLSPEAWSYNEDSASISWKTLKAGENITHVFPVTPIKAGQFQVFPSTLTYNDGNDKQKITSSRILFVEVKGSRSIGARSNLQGYLLFLVAACASIVIPLGLWWVSRGNSSKAKTA